MALQFIVADTPPCAVMFDDRNGVAFGPVIMGDDCMDRMASFLRDLNDDPRAMRDWELSMAYAAWESRAETPGAVTEAVSPTVEPPQPADTDREEEAWQDGATPPVTGESDGSPSPLSVPFETVTVQSPEGDVTVRREGWEHSVAPTAVDQPAPAQRPMGTRECWNCQGTRHEPNRPDTPCGICLGQGWLPA